VSIHAIIRDILQSISGKTIFKACSNPKRNTNPNPGGSQLVPKSTGRQLNSLELVRVKVNVKIRTRVTVIRIRVMLRVRASGIGPGLD